MPHLVDLTLGTEFIGNDKEIYKVTSSLNEKDKLIVELTRSEPVVNETLQELIKEN